MLDLIFYLFYYYSLLRTQLSIVQLLLGYTPTCFAYHPSPSPGLSPQKIQQQNSEKKILKQKLWKFGKLEDGGRCLKLKVLVQGTWAK